MTTEANDLRRRDALRLAADLLGQAATALHVEAIERHDDNAPRAKRLAELAVDCGVAAQTVVLASFADGVVQYREAETFPRSAGAAGGALIDFTEAGEPRPMTEIACWIFDLAVEMRMFESDKAARIVELEDIMLRARVMAGTERASGLIGEIMRAANMPPKGPDEDATPLDLPEYVEGLRNHSIVLNKILGSLVGDPPAQYKEPFPVGAYATGVYDRVDTILSALREIASHLGDRKSDS